MFHVWKLRIQRYTGKPVKTDLPQRCYFLRCIRCKRGDLPGSQTGSDQSSGKELKLKEALAETLKPMANVDYKAMVESGELIDGADTAAVIVYGRKNGQNVHFMNLHSAVHSMKQSDICRG